MWDDQICSKKLYKNLTQSLSNYCPLAYVEGPKNKQNLNVAHELEVVVRCAARCRESTQYFSSLPRGVNLDWLLLLLWLFF